MSIKIFSFQKTIKIMGHRTLEPGQEYRVIIRILPAGEEHEIDIPVDATGREIIESLLEFDEINAPSHDPEGNQIFYKLVSKNSGIEVKPDLSLFEVGVNNGDTLFLTPSFLSKKTIKIMGHRVSEPGQGYVVIVRVLPAGEELELHER